MKLFSFLNLILVAALSPLWVQAQTDDFPQVTSDDALVLKSPPQQEYRAQFEHPGELTSLQLRGDLLPLQNDEPDYSVPDADEVDDDQSPADASKFSNALFLTLFGAWAIVCFFVAMAVWSMAFQPRVEAHLYVQGAYTDLVFMEEVV